MNDLVLYFDEKILNYDVDDTELQDLINNLSQREYRRVDLKPMRGHKNLFRAKTSYEGRVLLSSVKVENKNYLVLVAHLPTHNYRNKWLDGKKRDPGSEYWLKQIKESEENDDDDELSSDDISLFQSIFKDPNPKIEKNRQKAFYINQSYISLSDQQRKVDTLLAPLLLSGSPGTGKTVMLVKVISNFLLANPHNPNNNNEILGTLIAASPSLINKLHRDWLKSPSYDPNDHRFRFMTYPDFAYSQDPSLKIENAVGINDFLLWVQKQNTQGINPIHIYKDFGFIALCDTFENYQALGSRNLHFIDPEQMKVIWNLFTTYKAYCDKHKLHDFGFYRFKITYKLELLCSDECQDLTPIQLMQLLGAVNNQQYYLAMDPQQSLLLNISVRPLFLKILQSQQKDFKIHHEILKRNYRMSIPVKQIVTGVVRIKNHLTKGVIDSDEVISIDDIESNGLPGQVKFVDLDNNSDDSEISAIASRPETAFIVPDEETRKRIMAKYNTGQVFLVIEAKGIEWKNVIVVNSCKNPDFVDIFRMANQQLPERLQDLINYQNRPKNKDDNSRIIYNSAFAQILVAFSRCMSHLYILEEENDPKNRILSLLKETVAEQPTFVPTPLTPVTREQWIEQINYLLDEGALLQARETAKKQLDLKVSDETSLEGLRELVNGKTASIGMEPTERIFRSKKKNKPKEEPSNKSSKTALDFLTTVEGTWSDPINMLAYLCKPNTLPYFIESLDNGRFKQTPITLKQLLQSNALTLLMQSDELAVEALSKLFKNCNYFKDNPDLSDFCLNKNANTLSPIMVWLLQKESGIQFLLDTLDNAPNFLTALLKPIGITYTAFTRNASTEFNKHEYLLWLNGSKTLKIGQDKALCNFLKKSSMQWLTLQRTFQAQLQPICSKISLNLITQNDKEIIIQILTTIFNHDTFKFHFFVSPETKDDAPSSSSLFLLILNNEQLVDIFKEFLASNPKFQEKFNAHFNFHFILPWRHNFTDNYGRKTYFNFDPSPISYKGACFLTTYFANPDSCRLLINATTHEYLRLLTISLPTSDPITWLTIHLISQPDSEFLHIMSVQKPEQLARYVNRKFNIENLGEQLKKLVRPHVKNWDLNEENPDMIDLLSLSHQGRNFLLRYLLDGKDPVFTDTLIQKLILSVTADKKNDQMTFLYRLLPGDRGRLILITLASIHTKAFTPFVELLTEIVKTAAIASNLKIILTQLNQSLREIVFSEKNKSAINLLSDSCDYFLQIDSRYQNPPNLTAYHAHIAELLKQADKSLKPKQSENHDKLKILFESQSDPTHVLFYQPSVDNSFFHQLLANKDDLLAFYLCALDKPVLLSQNLPMSLLIDSPLEFSLYNILFQTQVGRAVLGLLLQVRAFHLGSITPQQMMAILQMLHQSKCIDNSLSLFYILACTAGTAGHIQLLSLTNDPKVALLIEKSDLFMKNINDPDHNSCIPIDKLKLTEPGRSVLNNLAKIHSDWFELNIVLAQIKAYQSIISCDQYAKNNLMMQLARNNIDEFLKDLDTPEFKTNPVKLTLILNEDILDLIPGNEKKGVELLTKVFKNGRYFIDDPHLENFFVQSNQYSKILLWLLKRDYGVKFLIDVLDNVPTIVKTLLKPLDLSANYFKLLPSNLIKDSHSILYTIANVGVHNCLPVVNQVIKQANDVMLSLLNSYVLRFIKMIEPRTTINADNFNQFWHTLFSSRDFNRLFFMSPGLQSQPDSLPPLQSLFADIMSLDSVTHLFVKFLESNPTFKHKFENNFTVDCLFFRALNHDPKTGVHNLVGFPEPSEVSAAGCDFVLNYLSNPTFCKIDNVLGIKKYIIMSQPMKPNFNPLFWLIFNLISQPDNEFLFYISAIGPDLLQKFIHINFGKDNLQKNKIKNLVGENRLAHWDLFEDDPDMIDLLSLSMAGNFLLLNYLDHGNDEKFVHKLISKILASLSGKKINSQYTFLHRLTYWELSTRILLHLHLKHQSQFAPILKLIEKGLASTATADAIKSSLRILQQMFASGDSQHQSHLHAPDYFLQIDSRFKYLSNLKKSYAQFANQYQQNQKAIDRHNLPTLFSNPLIFVYNLFFHVTDYSNAIRTYCDNESHLLSLFYGLCLNPEYIASQNLSMSILIDESFVNSLYSKLCKTDLTRHLLGLFLQCRLFYLGSITTNQLIFTLELIHQLNLQQSKISLFYALSVTAGIKGHQHLFSLCQDPKLAMTLQKSDLLMTENSVHFAEDENDTPEIRLQATEPGRAVLFWIKQNNPNLSAAMQSPVTSSAELRQGFWNDNNNHPPALVVRNNINGLSNR